MSTSYRPIPDFLTLPDVFVGEIELRRNDLADLRLHVRHPEGIENGRCLSKQSRNRLIAHGMLGLGEDLDGNVRTFATDYGIAVARANSSCIDGSEGLSTTPGHREVGKDLTECARDIRVAGRITRGGLLIVARRSGLPRHIGRRDVRCRRSASQRAGLAGSGSAAHRRLRSVCATVWSWLRLWRWHARAPRRLEWAVRSAAVCAVGRPASVQSPINGLDALQGKERVDLREGAGTKEAAIGRQRRRVRRDVY
jgi:hypothetical protein